MDDSARACVDRLIRETFDLTGQRPECIQVVNMVGTRAIRKTTPSHTDILVSPAFLLRMKLEVPDGSVFTELKSFLGLPVWDRRKKANRW